MPIQQCCYLWVFNQLSAQRWRLQYRLNSSFTAVYFHTSYGLSSTQRWRLQYRLNIPFTVVYFHHVLWTFVNAKVEATIPTQHTSHGRLFSSHSMVLRRHIGGGYNTDSTHLSVPFIFVTFCRSSTSASFQC